jgi:hypothetical protein
MDELRGTWNEVTTKVAVEEKSRQVSNVNISY